MFRFSVRDLLWLTLVVAVALGWIAREARVLSSAKLRVEAALETANARQETKAAEVAAATAREQLRRANIELREAHLARKYLAQRLLDAMQRLGEFNPKIDPRPRWAD